MTLPRDYDDLKDTLFAGRRLCAHIAEGVAMKKHFDGLTKIATERLDADLKLDAAALDNVLCANKSPFGVKSFYVHFDSGETHFGVHDQDDPHHAPEYTNLPHIVFQCQDRGNSSLTRADRKSYDFRAARQLPKILVPSLVKLTEKYGMICVYSEPGHIFPQRE